MPAESKSQRRVMAIAKHQPGKLYKKNVGVLKMSQKQLGEYAKTSEKKLPKKKSRLHKRKGK